MNKGWVFSLVRSIVLVQVFIASIIAGLTVDFSRVENLCLPQIDLESFLSPLAAINLDEHNAAVLFKQVNVVFAGADNSGIIPVGYFETQIPEDLMVLNIQALTYIPKAERHNSVAAEDVLVEDIELPAIKREDSNAVKIKYRFPSEAKLVFYCSHSAESYIPEEGRARVDGKRGLVNEVARTLAEEVEKRGIKGQYINTIHDYPEYSQSYTNSRKTVQKVLESEQMLMGLFDIHRDSIPGFDKGQTVIINGTRSTQILIIVGTDERRPHPQWRKNLNFAQRIYQKGEEMYPGLIRGVRTKAGTYNQEFHDHALLLEFGNEHNTLAEVIYGARLFADVIIEVLQEEVN